MSSPTSEITPRQIAAPEHPQRLLTAGRPRSRGRFWLYAAICTALIAGLLFFWWRDREAKAAAAKIAAKPQPAIPVVAAQATTGNIGVYVTGLGAITPLSTVTVRSRVDGQLMSVHFKEGDLVKAGDPLIEIDPRPYQAIVVQVQGQLVRDQALLSEARVDLKRYQTLLAQDAIPEQQFATQKALVIQYEGTVVNDQGLLDAAKLNVAYSTIASPIAGVVGLRLVDPGNIVHASDTTGMIVVTQIQPISVIFTISEDQMPPVLKKINAGQKLAVDAWDRQLKNKLSTGYLSTIDNVIDPTTGTLKLRALFGNENRLLFPGQFVNARLSEQEKTGVILLASAAIQRNTNATYVYLIQANGAVTVRTVKVGTTEGDQSEIVSGLAAGDRVVMTGVDKLQEGSRVTTGTAAAPSQ